MLTNHRPHHQCPRHQRHQHHWRRRQRQQLTHQLTTINQPSTNLIYANAHTTLANGTASGTIIHSGTHTTLTTNITTTPEGSGLAGNGTAERARHHRHASPTLSYTVLQHAPPLPLTGRALQPTAGTTTTTSSRPSDTYWQPQPRAHKPTSNPRNRRSPTTPCHHAQYPPRPPQTRTRNTSERSRTPAAPPRPLRPPPPKDIYATPASTLAPMDAEQYYQSIQRDLPEDHATLQGGEQGKRNDNEWGTEEDLL